MADAPRGGDPRRQPTERGLPALHPAWFPRGAPLALSVPPLVLTARPLPWVSGVISQGIWASQKLSRGSLLDLSELQDPRTLGNLLIFGLYSKPIAYC